MSRTALVAIGGNALVLDGEAGSVIRQQERAAHFAEQVADLVAAGWTILVTHGNGPQVGFILRRGELVAPDAAIEGLPELPLWLAVADSQGGIGHILAVAMNTELERRGLVARAVAVLTHAEVHADDPAFARPTKPIGSTMSAETARLREAQEGWAVTETSPGTFRRVVPSPRPRLIVESAQIRSLMLAGAVVIAAGGGGIPVVRRDDAWHSVDAVIDKDRASALLAASAGVETLVLVTGVDEVYVGFGTVDQRALHDVGPDELRAHLEAGEFPAGSMGPKVESALQFVTEHGRHAVITSLPRLRDALEGRSGTHLTVRDHRGSAAAGAPPTRTPGEPMITVPADPFPFTFDPEHVALLCIDFQRDFMEAGGFGESLGNDVSRLRSTIAPTRDVLGLFRRQGWPVIHTREGHRPDLTDLFPAKRDRGEPALRIGDEGPMGRLLVRGSAGHGIVAELAPVEGEVVLDKPGKGSFYATDLETMLRARGITSLVVTGVTTEVCVQSTVREANDRGFESLILADCTGSYFPEFHRSALAMFSAQGGIVGWVGTSDALLGAVPPVPAPPAPRAALAEGATPTHTEVEQ